VQLDDIAAFSGENQGYAVAEALGLEAWLDMSGDDGTALFLEDGRILKTTSNVNETSIFMALKAAQDLGLSHPSVPRVDHIGRFVVDADLSELNLPNVRYLKYAIVRENFSDVSPEYDDWPEERQAMWPTILGHFAWYWRNGTPEQIADYLSDKGEAWPEIVQIHEGLEFVLATTGYRVFDLRNSNLGESPAGKVGMRDLGRAAGPVPEEGFDRDLPMVEPLPLAAPTP
jgi:hypothetical protein